MKPASILPILFLFLALLVAADAQAEINGFKGMRWGSNLADLQQTKKLTLTREESKSGASLYALENEEPRFGKATLTGIHCSFAQKRLQGVMLLFSGAKNFAAVRTEAFAMFGTSQKIDQNSEEMYNWPGTVTSVILSYNRSNQSGFLFMKARKIPPPQIKTEKKRDPSAQAAPVARSTPRPTPNPAGTPADDLETALDRAPPLPRQPGNVQDGITPEMQALIDRDQTLTHLCWETTGPAADAACMQMRENVERLESMGLCMQPGSSGASPGTAIVWHRCGAAGAAAPAPNAPEPGQPPAGPAAQQPNQQAALQTGKDQPEHCRLIGELFATAAQMRDNGAEPQIAEQELSWRMSSQTPGITIERIRETVELVYFDQEYSSIGGESLIQRVSDRCLSGRGPYSHPLP